MEKLTHIRYEENTGNRYRYTIEGSNKNAALNDVLDNNRTKLSKFDEQAFLQRYGCKVSVVRLFNGSEYCPAENSEYQIIKNEVIPDTDGTQLGTVLAQIPNTETYATWQYNYFPKTDFFNGFNNGHYFTNVLSADKDFHDRCAERVSSVIVANNVRSSAEFFVIPLYKETYETAKENNETDKFIESHKENIRCRDALNKAISESYHDNTFDSEKAFAAVIEEFPLNRIAHVVAANVYKSDWDMRYSPKVHAWAKEQFANLPEKVIELSHQYILNSHSGLINFMGERIIKAQSKFLTEERKDELLEYFNAETNEQETSEWRDNLSDEELKYVNELDNRFNAGYNRLAEALNNAGNVPCIFSVSQYGETIYCHANPEITSINDLAVAFLGSGMSYKNMISNCDVTLTEERYAALEQKDATISANFDFDNNTVLYSLYGTPEFEKKCSFDDFCSKWSACCYESECDEIEM